MNLNLTLGPLAMFAFVASITPGPNNLLLMRSGARFGIRRSVPHMIGIQVGFQGLLVLSYLGVGALLLTLPGGFTVLRWACFGYLLYLAVVILRDARPAAVAAATEAAELPVTPIAKPMRFMEGVLFQLINAKAWMMTVTVASAFYGTAKPTLPDMGMAAVTCLIIGSPSMLVWNVWGAAIEHVLKRPAARRAFNYLMAALVAATAFWMLR
jgi:threonine/homoserine/homoserine lactone efflux protein